MLFRELHTSGNLEKFIPAAKPVCFAGLGVDNLQWYIRSFFAPIFWGAVFHPGPRAADNACNSVSAAGLTLRGRSFFAAGSHLQALSASVDEAFFLFWRRVGTALPSPVSVV